MADRATLIALSVIAAALAVMVIVGAGGSGSTVVESRRVVPGFRPAAVERITLRGGEDAPVILERAGEGFAMVEPMQAPADDAAVDDLLGTIELLTWRRRGGAPSADQGLAPPAATVELELRGGGRQVIELGAHAGEIDRAWVARDGEIYLIDGYAARALRRSAEDLRSRRPLPFRRDQLTGIEISRAQADLVLSGRPLAVHLDSGGAVRAAPEQVEALVRRLHELRFERFAAAATEPEPGALTVRVIAAGPPLSLTALGPCPGSPELRLVDSSAGAGCVAAAELEAIAALAGQRSELLDRSLLFRDGRQATAVAIDAGETELALAAHGQVWTVSSGDDDEQTADAGAVRDWLEELADLISGEPLPVASVAPGPPEAVIDIAGAGDLRERIALHHHPEQGLLARRDAEPVFWPLAADSIVELLPQGNFQSRQLITREPWGLRRVRALAGGRPVEELVRGELAGDWSAATPANADLEPGIIEALRPVLAGLRAERFAGPDEATGLGRPRRVVEVELDPAPGGTEPFRHRIELGADADEGCYARIDRGAPAVLAEPDCAILSGPWTR